MLVVVATGIFLGYKFSAVWGERTQRFTASHVFSTRLSTRLFQSLDYAHGLICLTALWLTTIYNF
jgi:hypothetical protein